MCERSNLGGKLNEIKPLDFLDWDDLLGECNMKDAKLIECSLGSNIIKLHNSNSSTCIISKKIHETPQDCELEIDNKKVYFKCTHCDCKKNDKKLIFTEHKNELEKGL